MVEVCDAFPFQEYDIISLANMHFDSWIEALQTNEKDLESAKSELQNLKEVINCDKSSIKNTLEINKLINKLEIEIVIAEIRNLNSNECEEYKILFTYLLDLINMTSTELYTSYLNYNSFISFTDFNDFVNQYRKGFIIK